MDAFVAKLDGAKGTLEWHTFLGGPRTPTEDERIAAEQLGLRLPPTKGTDGSGIAVDARGSVYVAGRSDSTWGRPVRAHTGDRDAFGAKLDAKTGALVWNTFLGGKGEVLGHGGPIRRAETSLPRSSTPRPWSCGGTPSWVARATTMVEVWRWTAAAMST